MEKLCSIDGCQRPHLSLNMCSLHYQRVKKYGDPRQGRRETEAKAFESRFWSNVEKTMGCWLWIGNKTRDGYGAIGVGGKTLRAHRIAYEMFHGKIPEGTCVDHICHNRGCINPGHLRTATHKQNHENRAGADADSTSGVRGVYWRKDRQMWHAQVKHNQKRLHAGYFNRIEDAEAAVKAMRNELFTHNVLDRTA